MWLSERYWKMIQRKFTTHSFLISAITKGQDNHFPLPCHSFPEHYMNGWMRAVQALVQCTDVEVNSIERQLTIQLSVMPLGCQYTVHGQPCRY